MITRRRDSPRSFDRVVIRRGKLQLKLSKLQATNADLAEMMVGRSVFKNREASLSTKKEVVLSILKICGQ